MLKKSINSQLAMFGKTTVRGAGDKENPMIFKFSERDLPKYVYDKAALDEYVNAYDRYARANVVNIKRAHDIRDLGNTMNDRATELATMGRDPTYKNMADDEYSKVHDEFVQKYQQAKEKYENLVKETESDPNYKAHLNSIEYQNVVNQGYYERKYEGKRFDQIPDHEKPIYVANKYSRTTAMTAYRIPEEERALFDKGILIQSIPRVLEMDSNMEKLENTMKEVWKNSGNTVEQEFQKKELEENKAILSAYKQYVQTGSKEDKQKFYVEFTKAYDNAKQNFLNNPEMRSRFEFRADQLRHGDFSIVPFESRKDSIKYGMTADWDERMNAPHEKDYIEKLPKSVAQKQFERAFLINVDPLGRKALQTEVQRDAQKRPEYTLKQMGQSLRGADLEDYKATIHNDKMEKFNEIADMLNSEMKNAKDQMKALTKQYGFFGRLFNQNYKNQKAMIENDINFGRKKYEDTLKQTKYDIYKTYQEKGLAFTKAEKKEFDNIVKEATRTGKIKGWDEVRADEKKKLEEFNAKWLENEEPEVVEQPKEVKVIQLNLGDKIHGPKQKAQPAREEKAIDKEKEKSEVELEK